MIRADYYILCIIVLEAMIIIFELIDDFNEEYYFNIKTIQTIILLSIHVLSIIFIIILSRKEVKINFQKFSPNESTSIYATKKNSIR